MKVLVAGATGGLGRSLVPQLIAAGHEVTGMTRSESGASSVRSFGADVVLADGLDAAAVRTAVEKVRPEVVVHQMTALKGGIDFKHFDDSFAMTNRLRTEGTDNLLAASQAAGVRRFVVQSYAGWNLQHGGSATKTEADPLDPNPVPAQQQTMAAIKHLESAVLNADGIEGVALRYGSFYGPTGDIGKGGSMVEMIQKRRLPLIGDGTGIWSFIHYDDAASATVKAVESDVTGVFQIADDDPAQAAVWLPEFARILGAKPPRHVPAWIGRLAVGDVGVAAFTEIRGADNTLAKQTFGWQPGYASWREGFRKGL
ncbi:NAD-dependent epimerase/dehydratase family protein [Kribbella pratensis]|jgi:nucleoside-diphosphate-sugar epimerase|uniref:Nucleoside-diphosphate-sugar epimerase n=1 Tax=Kribbella pratensis TaxID=2512112 RepID=A0A4R8CHK8_9ACTN|nr:NAD(P)-dependent oxidoreductase [Kribbella pratensis]TDW75686.1 nucleoside-diphosphate-sugar epimerase [Kribbella pratensis]